MIVVLDSNVSSERIEEILSEMRALGLQGELMNDLAKPLIHVVDGPGRVARKLLRREGVQALIPTSGPRNRSRGRYFSPYHTLNWATAVLVVIGIVVALSGFLPPGLGEEIDRNHPAPIAVPWFLRAPAFLLRYGWPGSLALVVIFALVFFLPRIDRTSGTGAGRVPLLLVGLLVLAAYLALAVA